MTTSHHKQLSPSPIAWECSSCGTVHQTISGVPVGWSAVPEAGMMWCNDCTTLGIPAREINANRKMSRPRRAA